MASTREETGIVDVLEASHFGKKSLLAIEDGRVLEVLKTKGCDCPTDDNDWEEN